MADTYYHVKTIFTDQETFLTYTKNHVLTWFFLFINHLYITHIQTLKHDLKTPICKPVI